MLRNIDPDIVLQVGLALAAVIGLCVLQPRWDTGAGALMIFVLGIVGLPVWAPLLMFYCAIMLVGMAGVFAWWASLPFWWITKPLWRRFYYSFRHRAGEPVDAFWTSSYFSELAA